MSGLSNEPRTGGAFVNFKEGKLINSKVEFTTLTGHIIDLAVNPDEYQGQAYQKVTLFIQDDEGKIFLLGFNMTSGYGRSFFRMCPNINYAEPVSIGAGTEDIGNGQTYGKMFIQQNKKYIQHYFKKGTKAYEAIPLVKETFVGAGKNKKKVLDSSERDTYIESVLAGILTKQIQKAFPKGADAKYHKMAIGASEGNSYAAGGAEPNNEPPF